MSFFLVCLEISGLLMTEQCDSFEGKLYACDEYCLGRIEAVSRAWIVYKVAYT